MSIRMNTEDVIARGREIGSHVEDVTALQNYLNDVVNRQLISAIGQGVVMNAQQYAEFDRAAGAMNRG